MGILEPDRGDVLSLKLRYLKVGFVAAFLTIALALAACGGGKSNSSSNGPLTEKEAAAVTNNFFLTFFGTISGSKSADDLLGLFTQECRKGVSAQSISGVLGLIRAFMPELGKAKIEAFDGGALNVQSTSAGFQITPKDISSARVKVNGKWIPLDQLGSALGFKDSSSSFSPTTDEPIIVQRESGKWLLSDCSTLKDFSADEKATITINGTPSATSPTPNPNQPGASRAKPIALGQSATVEKQWQITVSKVNRDAWPVIQANSKFADPPAANERLVLIEVSAKNVAAATGNKAANIDDFSFRITGSRNQLYSSYDGKHDCGSVPNELDADLFPGGEAKGNVCFKLTTDETGLLLVWQSFTGGDPTYFDLGF
jgi:hypothetical protein